MKKSKCTFSPFLFKMVLEDLDNTTKQEKEIKVYRLEGGTIVVFILKQYGRGPQKIDKIFQN